MTIPFFIGVFTLAYTTHHIAQQNHSIVNNYVIINGLLTDYSYKPQCKYHHCYTLLIYNLYTQQEYQPLFNHKTVLVSTKIPLIAKIGDGITLEPIYHKTPFSVSYEHYLQSHAISAHLYKKEILMYPCFNQTFLERCYSQFIKIKYHLYASLHSHLSAPARLFFDVIFLGKKQGTANPLSSSIHDLFNTWGLAHYLARAGLHITLFLTLLLSLLTILPWSFNYKQLFLLLGTLVYTLFSWANIPYTRALLTFFLITLCKLLYIRSNTLHLLCGVYCCLLLYNPLMLLTLEFQLSFFLTFLLYWFSYLRLLHQAQLPITNKRLQ
jgi:hypothetical protein